MVEQYLLILNERTALRTSAKKLVKTAEKLNSESPAWELEAVINQIELLKSRLERVKNSLAECADYQPQQDELATELTYLEPLEEQGFRISALLKYHSSSVTQPTSAQPTNGVPFVSLGSNTTSLKRPSLTLPIFSGEISKWFPFWEQFEAAIDKSNFPAIEKFIHLRQQLSGVALRSISGLQLTEQNYAAAKLILQERFGRNEQIIQHHLNSLLNLKPVHNANNTLGLRSLYDFVNAHIKSLEALGESLNCFSALLLPILKKAVPNELLMDFMRREDDRAISTEPNVGDSSSQSTATAASVSVRSYQTTRLLQFLRKEIEYREDLGLQSTTQQNASNFKPHSYTHDRRSNSSKTSLANMHISNSPSVSCYFCKGGHATESCNVHNTLEWKKNELKKELRCFKCTRGGHQSRSCQRSIKCGNCSGRHATSMCDPAYTQQLQQPRAQRLPTYAPNVSLPQRSSTTHQSTPVDQPHASSNPSAAATTNGTYHASSSEQDGGYVLQTATVWAEGDVGRILTRCLLDGGSERTFILGSLAKKLNLKVIGEEDLIISPFGGAANSARHRIQRVELWLRSQHDRTERRLEALAVNVQELCAKPHFLPSSILRLIKTDARFQPAADACENLAEKPIEIIIGADNYWKLCSTTNVKVNENLVATQTCFGFIFSGTSTNQNGVVTTLHHFSLHYVASTNKGEPTLDKELRRFWELEHIGITPHEKTIESDIVKTFDNQLEFSHGRYTSSLLWKDRSYVDSNELVAKRRLNSLTSKLQANPEMLKQYDGVIRDYVQQGFAKQLCHEEQPAESAPCYYMPHRAVIRTEKSSTPLRVVFDASSHGIGNTSLNEHLHSGKNLNPELLSVLLTFRCFKIAVTADIEKAFHQICIRECDQDALRFFWYNEPLATNKTASIVTLRMTRLPFGLVCSPFILCATLRFHLAKYATEFPDTCNILQKQLYVDDLLGGADTPEAAYKLRIEAEDIMSQAGMRLRKWKSSAPSASSETLTSPTPITDNNVTDSQEKVLGMSWDNSQDVFAFVGLQDIDLGADVTKRSILRIAARVFDPLGFFLPFTVTAKLLLQQLWKIGVEWDADVPSDILSSCRKWMRQLTQLSDIVVPRYMNYTAECHMHVFTDASESAYGAAVYVSSPSGTAHLCIAKSRVAPLKKLSVPRLELTAALVGARLAHYVLENLTQGVSNVTYWTDSQISLCWIRGDPSCRKTFVANRVVEICELSEPSNWKYCPGVCNPADLLTRGVDVGTLKNSKLWWHGPEFICHSSSDWPEQPMQTVLLPIDENRNTSTALTTTISEAPNDTQTQTLFDITRFSSVHRLHRSIAYVGRALSKNKPETLDLTSEEITKAETAVIRYVQREQFEAEVKALQSGNKLDMKSKIRDFAPYLDSSGILRVGGRLHNYPSDHFHPHPIILPDGHYAALIVRAAHQRTMHGGVRDTLVELRERFFVLHARRLIRRVIIRDCVVCKRYKKKLATAPVASLPADRLTQSDAFDIVGLDFAGPLLLKNNHKVYILLITCANTRAVHLELVTDLSTRSFLLAFRRFISRRGLCSVIYSDNALTFKRASKDLTCLFKSARSSESLSFLFERGIQWKFLVERSPWWAGFYERMVGTVKACLRRVLGKAYLNIEEMETVLCEVEAVINSRPLTYVYTSPNEPQALSPSHFLVGRRLLSLPNDTGKGVCTATPAELNRRWMRRQHVIGQFWKRWHTEYLADLRSAHQYTQFPTTQIREGDLVLIQDENRSRLHWKMGVIIRTLPSRSSTARSFEIRVADGKTLRRPIQRLCPLEIR